MNENLSFLTKYFSLNELEIVDEYSMEIKNPYNGENICILDESYEDYYQITVYFSYQHRHMYDEQKIIEYINDIVNGNVFAIEFFLGEERHFGGEISKEELNSLSYKELEQRYGYYGSTKLIQLVDSFKVRGWNPKDSFDARFVKTKNDIVIVKKEFWTLS